MSNYKNIWLHNSVAQHALSFPPSLIPERYDIDRSGKNTCIVLNKKGKRLGRVVITEEGGYCIGFPFGENIHLPTKFDLGILYGLIAISGKKNWSKKLVFKSRYNLLLALGIKMSGKNYARTLESLYLWKNMTINYIGRYYDSKRITPKLAGRDQEFYIIHTVDVPSTEDDDSEITVFFVDYFLDLFKPGKYRAQLDPIVISKLRSKSEAALNIYQFLRSFHLLLLDGSRITRNMEMFYEIVVGRDLPGKRSRWHSILKKAITDINNAIPEDGKQYGMGFLSKERVTFYYVNKRLTFKS